MTKTRVKLLLVVALTALIAGALLATGSGSGSGSGFAHMPSRNVVGGAR